ncbi:MULTISPECIES: hypothetical protein [unclassified Sphingopyxis]|jgi:hypothetical protein|uniref:hypothetical protein n=1 Tax=unclassified Sphingopyxis TaxID=2614943 RepID=UPI0006C10CF3|nr:MULTISPECIES: hypothetical protein [unclassified Sphingopyxis]USI78867.1 hypothetical protein KEC45_08255 [Sphingopyxis sp. USTB-05]GAO78746.1 hypothetical protein SC1_02056 [Sphingopyxis sp. C-1]
MDSDNHINIRTRVREYGARRLVIARLNAPADWQSELRTALAAHREPATIFSNNDFRLFLQSFAIFFTAAMMFLI